VRHEDYKKLKSDVKNKNFFNGYRVFSRVSYYLSFVGNFFSIFLAYFFISGIITKTILEPTESSANWIVAITIVILFTVELVKRFVFDKFSMESIKQKFMFKGPEIKVLTFFSACLIAASFYLSLNGAKQYADKDIEIEHKKESNIEVYEDSLKTHYGQKIAVVDSQVVVLRNANLEYDNRLKILDEKDEDLSVNTWQERQEKRRIQEERKSIRDDKDRNLEQMDKLEVKIKEIKKERDDEILKFKKKEEEKAVEQIEDNSGNPVRFLIFSTIIELVILFGIWFINYYKYRSIKEYEDLVAKNPKYKLFNQWNELLSIIYGSSSKLGDTLPYKTEMMKLLKANSFDFSAKELDDALKVFTHLGILKKKGNKKALSMGEEEAREMIKEHFKIE
jgi:hypothetical protein